MGCLIVQLLIVSYCTSGQRGVTGNVLNLLIDAVQPNFTQQQQFQLKSISQIYLADIWGNSYLYIFHSVWMSHTVGLKRSWNFGLWTCCWGFQHHRTLWCSFTVLRSAASSAVCHKKTPHHNNNDGLDLCSSCSHDTQSTLHKILFIHTSGSKATTSLIGARIKCLDKSQTTIPLVTGGLSLPPAPLTSCLVAPLWLCACYHLKGINKKQILYSAVD